MSSTRTDTRKPIDRFLDAMREAGRDPLRNGSGWKASCPAHDGEDHNLKISEGTDGTVLLKCHSHECGAKEIVESIGLDIRDLFPRKAAEPGKKSPERRIDFKNPVAKYAYRDAGGSVRFQVRRLNVLDASGKVVDKTFRQYRPDGKGGWVAGLDKVEPILYHLPELQAADPDRPVWLTEGEKDCDNLTGKGRLATCNPMGAGKWLERYAEYLRGRIVIIIPDNDQAGRDHAQQVARSLHGVAASVKVMELPGLPEKGDVSDFLARGGTVDDLDELAHKTREWTPAPDQTQADDDSPKLTEWGNAKRLIHRHGHRLRYCKPYGHWLDWDGTHWIPDQIGAIWRWAKDTVRQLGREAAETDDDERRRALLRWAIKSEDRKTISAMIELAWSEPGVALMPDDLDADPWLLNCPNGTVDLRTGDLRPHRQSDLITRLAPVPFDPAAKCSRWETVLGEILEGDSELISFLQRALGYSLTGDVGEHAMFLCHGSGRNGKNTVIDAVQSIVGDYAFASDPRVFLHSGKNEHPAGLASLVGRRLVTTDEVDDGDRLSEGLIKRVTGNPTLNARFMRQNPFEFKVQFKLWMLANHKPEIGGQDEGIWSRVKLIPFEHFFPPEKRIKGLSKILVRDEGPGILAWLVRGCLAWKDGGGLNEPKKVIEATKEYRSEQDVMGDFLDQCCNSFLDHPTLREQAREKASVLYSRYLEWCKENGEKKVLTNRKFGSELKSRGYQLKPSNGTHFRLGIAVKPDQEKGNANDNGAY
jgi:putative DNA primase/helicase